MALSKELLQFLVCPRCKQELVPAEEGLDCIACGLRYPVRNGIPVMLPDQAERIVEG
jgi:hypothetical protein